MSRAPPRTTLCRSFSKSVSSTTKNNNGKEQQEEPPTEGANNEESPTMRGFDDLPINFADISRAEVSIRGGVKRTVCEHSPFLSDIIGVSSVLSYLVEFYVSNFLTFTKHPKG